MVNADDVSSPASELEQIYFGLKDKVNQLLLDHARALADLRALRAAVDVLDDTEFRRLIRETTNKWQDD